MRDGGRRRGWFCEEGKGGEEEERREEEGRGEERREKREGKEREGNFGMLLLLSMGVVEEDEDTVGSCGYSHSVVSMPEGAYVRVWVCLPNLGISIRQTVILDEQEKGNVFE